MEHEWLSELDVFEGMYVQFNNGMLKPHTLRNKNYKAKIRPQDYHELYTTKQKL